jgi:hypothetical protein
MKTLILTNTLLKTLHSVPLMKKTKKWVEWVGGETRAEGERVREALTEEH